MSLDIRGSKEGIEVRGLDEIHKRMQRFPKEYEQATNKTMEAALYAVQGEVPPYPPQPTGTRYRRTGMLGRSLGVSFSGGRLGRSEIWQIRKLGGGYNEGRFGTSLNYAQYVIGDRGQQSGFMSQYWWRLEQVPGKAFNKVKELFEGMARALAQFLEGKGL